MKLLTTEEKKSLVITALFFAIFLLTILLWRVSAETDPPITNMIGGGIAVNLGTSDVGMGDIQPMEQAPAEEAKTKTKEEQPDILTHDNQQVETAVVSKSKEKSKETPKPQDNTPKPSAQTSTALNSILNGSKSSGNTSGNHGNDGLPGDKGDPNGSLYANSFYGNGVGSGTGSGGGTGWGLKGRRLASNGKIIKQDCNEEGRVVIKVWVSQNGNVTKAERAQGTTNTNPCLVNPALETAKSFKWLSDSKAPETQIGFVVINFQLGE